MTATFSEGMAANTLNTSTFVLVKKGSTTPIAATVGYSDTAKKATLNPKRDLKPGATYVATLKGGASGEELLGQPPRQGQGLELHHKEAVGEVRR